MRAPERRDEYLKQAEHVGGEAHLLRTITEAELLLKDERITEALAALQEVRRVAPKSVAALRLELKAHTLAGDWDSALELIDRLEKVNGIAPAYADQARLGAWLGKLKQKSPDASALTELWRTLPADYRKRTVVAFAAASYLLAHGEQNQAAEIIEGSLAEQWDSGLAELYGDCPGDNSLARLQRAEAWLQQQPRDARLLLTLGKLCIHQQLWGKAQSYIEASLAIEPSPAAHVALAQLLEHLGQQDEALKQYWKGVSAARPRTG